MTGQPVIRHIHRCMRCGAEFYCLSPIECGAAENVMPRVVVPGPYGQQVFEHVCDKQSHDIPPGL